MTQGQSVAANGSRSETDEIEEAVHQQIIRAITEAELHDP